MKLIKLNAIDSTNTFLSELSRVSTIENPTVVLTDNQTAGRGQRGSAWFSEPGKSLSMSIYLRPKQLLAQDQFYLSMLVSLSVQKVLKDFEVPKTTVKWPNDILSYSKKLVGILIENTIKQGEISASIIGIGVNVNTSLVKSLPKLGSMYTQTNKNFVIEEVAKRIAEDLVPKIENLSQENYADLKDAYEHQLFRKDEVSTFIDKNNQPFSGIIRGVTDIGELQIETSLENTMRLYWPKEVSLQY